MGIKERMNKEKELSESTIKQDFNMQKRLITVDFDKMLETEKQKLKLVENKLDEKCAEIVQTQTANEEEKAKIITDMTERLNNETEAVECVKSERKSALRLADKSLIDLKKSHEMYSTELKTQTSATNWNPNALNTQNSKTNFTAKN